MATSRGTPVPIFSPWDGRALTVRHHEHQERIARIAYREAGWAEPDAPAGWYLSWHSNYLTDSFHETALHAVAAARDSYADYLAAEDEALRESNEREEYHERFLRRQAGAVARALRIPTGGQKGWAARPKPPSST